MFFLFLKGILRYKKFEGLKIDFFKVFMFGIAIIGAAVFSHSWELAGIGAGVMVIGYAQKHKWQELAEIRQDYSLLKNYDRKKLFLVLMGLAILIGVGFGIYNSILK